MTATFARQMTVTASTKRGPAISGGKRGAPVAEIASLTVTPLDPLDAEIRNRLEIETPVKLKQTFTLGSHDIVDGDVLVVATVEYPIKYVEAWPAGPISDAFKLLVVEELQR